MELIIVVSARSNVGQSNHYVHTDSRLSPRLISCSCCSGFGLVSLHIHSLVFAAYGMAGKLNSHVRQTGAFIQDGKLAHT